MAPQALLRARPDPHLMFFTGSTPPACLTCNLNSWLERGLTTTDSQLKTIVDYTRCVWLIIDEVSFGLRCRSRWFGVLSKVCFIPMIVTYDGYLIIAGLELLHRTLQITYVDRLGS